MLLIAVLKSWHVVAIVALIGVLAVYKYVTAKMIDQPSHQSDQIDMLSKRINHLENQLTQVTHQLNELLEQQNSDGNQTND